MLARHNTFCHSSVGVCFKSIDFLWGVKLGREFFVSMRDYYPYEEINKFQKGVLITQGDADTIVPVSYAYKTADLYENSELIVLSGERHGFSTAGSIAVREYCVEFMQEN